MKAAYDLHDEMNPASLIAREYERQVGDVRPKPEPALPVAPQVPAVVIVKPRAPGSESISDGAEPSARDASPEGKIPAPRDPEPAVDNAEPPADPVPGGTGTQAGGVQGNGAGAQANGAGAQGASGGALAASVARPTAPLAQTAVFERITDMFDSPVPPQRDGARGHDAGGTGEWAAGSRPSGAAVGLLSAEPDESGESDELDAEQVESGSWQHAGRGVLAWFAIVVFLVVVAFVLAGVLWPGKAHGLANGGAFGAGGFGAGAPGADLTRAAASMAASDGDTPVRMS